MMSAKESPLGIMKKPPPVDAIQKHSNRSAHSMSEQREKRDTEKIVESSNLSIRLDGRKPDGRKCNLCIRTDDSWCPLQLAVDGKKVFIAWGKKPDPVTGKTTGSYCVFCVKYYNGAIRLLRSITMGMYEKELGGDERLLRVHMTCVDMLVQKIINKGGNMSTQMDWAAIEHDAKETLTVVEKKSDIVKPPGCSHVELTYYLGQFGNVAENATKGHREYTYNGIKGVLVPDAPITRFETTEALETELRKELSSTESGTSSDQLRAQAAAVASTFSPLQDNEQCLSKCIQDLLAASAADPARLAADEIDDRAHPPPKATPPVQLRQGLLHGLEQGIASGPTLRKQHLPSRVDIIEGPPAAAPKGKSTAARSVRDATASNAGTQVRITPRPKPSGGGKVVGSAKKTARGRPQKDRLPEVDEIAHAFQTSKETDPSFWGAEVKTQIKHTAALAKVLVKMMQDAPVDEAPAMNVALKKLQAIIAIITVAKDHTLESKEFREEYDMQLTKLRLEPVTEVAFPPHVRWARHKQDIRDTEDVDRWLDRVSVEKLREAGVLCIADEQDKLLATRFASYLKVPDEHTRSGLLRRLFDADKEVDLDDGGVDEFYDAMVVILAHNEIQDLPKRIDLLSGAIEGVKKAMPDAKAGVIGTTCGNVLAQYPQGKMLIDLAILHCTKGHDPHTPLHSNVY